MMTIIQKLEAWLWSETGSFLWVRRFLQLLYRIAIQYNKANFKERAQALTYTTMLSLVPLMAITFSILAGFGVHNELEPLMLKGFSFLGEESAQQFVSVLIGFVENTRGVILGGVGLVVLLYTVINLMTTIESAFNRIWRVSKGRNLKEQITAYVVVILVGPILGFVSLSLLSSSIFLRVSGYVTDPLLSFLLSQAFTIFVVTVVIWLGYIFITFRQVNWLPALIGALFAANAWYFVGKLFTQFVVLSGKQSQIYSGFASVVLFIMWMYLSWIIVLVGNQIAYYLQFSDHIAHDDDPTTKPSQVEVTLCLEAKDIDRQEWVVKHVKSQSVSIATPQEGEVTPDQPGSLESVVTLKELRDGPKLNVTSNVEISEVEKTDAESKEQGHSVINGVKTGKPSDKA